MSAELDNQPYDNVEFPVRRQPPSGSGTWPGPVRDPTAFKVNMAHSQTKGYALAPLVEGREVGMDEEDEGAEILKVEDKHPRVSASVTATRSSVPSTTAAAAAAAQTPPMESKVNHTQSSRNSSGSSVAAKPPSTGQSSSATFPRAQKQASRPSPSPGQESKNSAVLEPPRAEDFTWNDFNPASQGVFDTAYTRHKYFYKFTDSVLKQGTRLKSGVWDGPGKPGETMTYEQLLQGALVEGEKLLLGGVWLNFRTIEFFAPEETRRIKPSLGEGRICLTNLRLLLLCAETAADAQLSEYGDPCDKGGGYKLEVSKLNNIYFQNIPLDCFESVELSSSVGTAADTKMTLKPPMCCGLFSCVGVGRCGYTWNATPPLPMNISKRTIRLGVYMPPWRTPTVMLVHLHPKTSLTSARDFVAQIQNHVPQMQFHIKHVPTVL